MLSSLSNLVLAVGVALVCLGAGRALLRRSGFQFASVSEGMALSAGTGFGMLIYVMVLLGAADLYQSAVAWGLVLALGSVGAWDVVPWRGRAGLANYRRYLPPRLRPSWPLAAMLVVLAAYGTLYLIVALTPTFDGDSIAGYLVTAREYARQGGIVSVDYAYTNSYPANGQMISTLGFLLHGQILAQLLLVWLMGLLALGAIYALGRAWFSAGVAVFAMAIWYGMNSVGFLAASAKIDLAWAAFELLSLLAFSRWYFAKTGDRDWRWLLLAGAFLGIAGGVKHASVFTALVLAVAVAVQLLRDRRFRPGAWMGAYLALGAPAALSGIWAIRSYVVLDDPTFTGSGLPGDSGVLGFFRTLWQMSMLGNAPSTDGVLGKSIGPTVLAAVPVLLLFRNVDRRVWHILGFSGIVLVLWFFGVQRARHLLPTLALLSLVAGYVVALLLVHRPRLGHAVVALVFVSLALNLANWGYVNLVSLQRVPYVLGLHDRDEYLAANLPKLYWYPNHAIVVYARAHLDDEARIAALSTTNSYYLDRPLYVDWTQTANEVSEPRELAARLQASGMTHVLTNQFVMDKRNLNNSWLAQPEFQSQYLKALVCDDGQCLYALSLPEPDDDASMGAGQ